MERASRAREDMNRYRLELNRVKRSTPKEKERKTVLSKTLQNEDEKKSLEIVPTSPTASSRPRTLPPTQINVHLPPDWDGREIEIFMSEDEYEDDDDEYEEDNELPPVPADSTNKTEVLMDN